MAPNSSPATGDGKGDQAKKRIYCIISDDRVFRTKSPAMFNAALEHSGIDGMYIPLEVAPANLGQAVKSMVWLNFSGANITVPYKEKVMPYLDILSEGANIIRAVNTITLENGQLKGYNTNAIGFMKAMEEVGFQPADRSVLIFGAGGAARAVVFILNWLKAKPIFVAARNFPKAKSLCKDLGGEPVSFEDLTSRQLSANLLVNATSVSSPEESPRNGRHGRWARRLRLPMGRRSQLRPGRKFLAGSRPADGYVVHGRSSHVGPAGVQEFRTVDSPSGPAEGVSVGSVARL